MLWKKDEFSHANWDNIKCVIVIIAILKVFLSHEKRERKMQWELIIQEIMWHPNNNS